MRISSLEGIVRMGDLVSAVSVHELFGPWSSRLGTGRPGVLQSTVSPGVGHNWMTDQQQVDSWWRLQKQNPVSSVESAVYCIVKQPGTLTVTFWADFKSCNLSPWSESSFKFRTTESAVNYLLLYGGILSTAPFPSLILITCQQTPWGVIVKRKLTNKMRLEEPLENNI